MLEYPFVLQEEKWGAMSDLFGTVYSSNLDEHTSLERARSTDFASSHEAGAGASRMEQFMAQHGDKLFDLHALYYTLYGAPKTKKNPPPALGGAHSHS